jgi:hypothetical protein
MVAATQTKPPVLKPAASNNVTLVATNQGWVNSRTGEILHFMKGLLTKKTAVSTGPTFTLVLPSNATYGTGQTIQFTVNSSAALTLVGNPTIALTLTSGIVLAKYVPSASTSTSLVFRYTVKKNDLALSGITVANIFTLTNYSSDGNGTDRVVQQIPGSAGVAVAPAKLTYTVGSTSLIKVQGL